MNKEFSNTNRIKYLKIIRRLIDKNILKLEEDSLEITNEIILLRKETNKRYGD
jgi:hypothetical protein